MVNIFFSSKLDVIIVLYVLLLLAGSLPTVVQIAKAKKSSHHNPGVSNVRNLGDKVGDLTGNSAIKTGRLITCSDFATCIGTTSDDIMYAGSSEQVYGIGGNDFIFGTQDNQLYGGTGNDMITTGTGSNYADGGTGDDVLLGSAGNNLIVGGSGNDKLFAGSGNTIMDGGPGSDHFDCGPSSTSVASKAVILDYNPSQGDTIAGSCKIVNPVSSTSSTSLPQITSAN